MQRLRHSQATMHTQSLTTARVLILVLVPFAASLLLWILQDFFTNSKRTRGGPRTRLAQSPKVRKKETAKPLKRGRAEQATMRPVQLILGRNPWWPIDRGLITMSGVCSRLFWSNHASSGHGFSRAENNRREAPSLLLYAIVEPQADDWNAFQKCRPQQSLS